MARAVPSLGNVLMAAMILIASMTVAQGTTRQQNSKNCRPSLFERLNQLLRGSAPVNADIGVNGVRFPRISEKPAPLTFTQKKFADSFYHAVMDQGRLTGRADFRSAEYADQVLATQKSQPLPEKVLGDYFLVRVQDFNLTPSLAVLYRASQLTGKKVIVVYHRYSENPARFMLRPLENLDGIPVAPELKGKILQIGNPAIRDTLPPNQSSDDFLEAIEGIRVGLKEQTGEDFFETENTVMSHGAGVFDSVKTRERLAEAGLGRGITRLIAVSAPRMENEPLPLLIELARKAMPYSVRKATGGKDYADTLEFFAHQGAQFTPNRLLDQYVDLSVSGSIGRASDRTDQDGIRPIFQMTAAIAEKSTRKGSEPTLKNIRDCLANPATCLADNVLLRNSEHFNGAVDWRTCRYGKKFHRISLPVDHGTIWERVDVFDEIVANIPQGTNSTPD